MSLDLLRRLQQGGAFDPAPVRHDLGVYHVDFSRLVPGTSPEDTLASAVRTMDRIALVGRSGSGKSSITASVLGPLAEGLAPVVVPLAMEPGKLVTEPQALFAHLVDTLGSYAREAWLIDDEARDDAVLAAAPERVIGRTGDRSLRLSAGWMAGDVAAELRRQGSAGTRARRSARETLEVLYQMLRIIEGAGLVPVLVFDDTDRWLRGAFAHPESLLRSFCGRVLPELRDLPCSIVMAVHRTYLDDAEVRDLLGRTLTTRIDVPQVASAEAIGSILHSRVVAHGPDRAGIDDVIDADAVGRLYEHYRARTLPDLRAVLRTAHTALAEACDDRHERITAPMVDAAVALWTP